MLLVIAGDGVESLFGFPANVGIGRAVLAVGEDAHDAECCGVDVVARVLAVGGEREAEAHDVRPVDAGLVEQLELVDEESGLGLFVSRVHRTRGRVNRRTAGICIPARDIGAALKVLRNSGLAASRQEANPNSVMATGFPVARSRLILVRYWSALRACWR